MATVVSKTSQKVDDLLANVVVSGYFDPNGRLLLNTWSGAVLNAGSGITPITVKTWDSYATYKYGDIVGYAGGIYLSLQDDNFENFPPLDGYIWKVIVAADQNNWVEGDPYFDGAANNLGVGGSREWNTANRTGTVSNSITTTPGEFETGPQAMRLTLAPNSTIHMCQLRENVVHGGEVVTVTVRARLAAAASGVTLDARLYQSDPNEDPQGAVDGVTTSSAEGPKALTSTAWTTYTFTITAANSKLRGTMDLLFVSPTDTVSILVDKVRVKRT